MIWYVEDDDSIRDIAIYALNSAGFETRGFEDDHRHGAHRRPGRGHC